MLSCQVTGNMLVIGGDDKQSVPLVRQIAQVICFSAISGARSLSPRLQ